MAQEKFSNLCLLNREISSIRTCANTRVPKHRHTIVYLTKKYLTELVAGADLSEII